MSLVVWLPLTKDLRQQGIDGAAVTNNSVTYSSTGGKLGGCYSFNSGSSAKLINNLKTNVTSAIGSLACWVKFNSFPTSSTWFNLMQVGSLGGFATCRLGIYMEYTDRINVSINGSTTNENAYTHSLSTNTWYHICATYDGTLVKLYINGIEVMSKTATVGSYTTAAPYVYVGGTSNYYLNGYMNDVRYYDHCLSPMEVKEIAKGLVLHYPLNRNGWGQENLLLNTQVLTPNSSTTTKNCSQRGAAARQLRTDGFYEAKCTSSWQGLSTWANAQNLVVGQKYTYSFYFYTDGSTKALSFYPMMFNSSGTRDTSSTLPISVDGSSYQSANARAFGYFSNSTPIKHYVTFEWNSTMASIISNGGTIELSIQVHGTFNSGEYGCVYAPKLEIGDKMTPWCPNIADSNNMNLNGTTEYDCSGFCNNANSNGSAVLTYSSDTPKYSVSTVFQSGSRIATPISASEFLPTDAITVSIWFKSSAAANRFLSCTEGGGFNFESASGKISFPIYIYGKGYTRVDGNTTWATVSDNQWHMITATYDKVTTKLYVDGILDNQTASSYPNIAIGYSSITPFTLGAEAQTITSPIAGTYVGSLSDCRIYATALSADNVLSLYKNSHLS